MAAVIGSAVVTKITNGVISKVIEKYNKQSAVDENLQKLEMLCIKIHSTVEASEKHLFTNNYLLKWQEKLKEAVIDGDEVLFTFHWRALNGSRGNTDNQIGTSSPLAYTKIVMSSVVHSFQNATKMLLSLDKDMEELSNTVDELEKISADTEEFLRLVELDVSINDENAPLLVDFTCTARGEIRYFLLNLHADLQQHIHSAKKLVQPEKGQPEMLHFVLLTGT